MNPRPAPDKSPVISLNPMPADPRNPMTRSAALDRVLVLLRQQPMTMPELAERLPAAPRSTQRWLRELQARQQVHLGRWTRSENNRQVPVFMIGGAPPATPPRRSTPAENMRRFNARKAGVVTPMPETVEIRTTWRFGANNRPEEGQKAEAWTPSN